MYIMYAYMYVCMCMYIYYIYYAWQLLILCYHVNVFYGKKIGALLVSYSPSLCRMTNILHSVKIDWTQSLELSENRRKYCIVDDMTIKNVKSRSL